MLDRIDRLVFYFNIDCGLCHNKLKVSHVTLEEQQGALVCSLCGKPMKVPEYEPLVAAAKTMNGYLSDKGNAKYIQLVLNEHYVAPKDEVPAAAH